MDTPLRLVALVVDAVDPGRVAGFWSGLLGWDPVPTATGVALRPTDDTGFLLRFEPVPEPKVLQNRSHFDLTSSSPDDQRATVDRALALGGRPADVGQRGDEGHVVLADPEGNEFCVIEPGNRFLADCGFVGALACDGTRAVGLFWSEALGWPLVWDQGEETAVRSPHGGPKVTWGGPPLMPRAGRDRLRFEVAPPPGGDPEAAAERLVSLGATRLSGGETEAGRIRMADPDGTEFGLLRAWEDGSPA